MNKEILFCKRVRKHMELIGIKFGDSPWNNFDLMLQQFY